MTPEAQLTVFSREQQRIEMSAPSRGDVRNAHHRLGALDHPDNTDRILAPGLLVARAQRLNTADDPLDVVGLVGLGQRDGLDVPCA